MTYENTGYVTERTENNMSLAWSLRYRPRMVGELLFMFRYTSALHDETPHLKLKGIIKPENMFRWLQQHHDLELADEIKDGHSWF
jgi:hypothetical protein